MIFILNIYKKDNRTKSKRRILGSYEFYRKDKQSMDKEIAELRMLYKIDDGYSLEYIEK